MFLPRSYKLDDWNLASVKGVVPVGHDSLVFYGGAGVWLTNYSFTQWKPAMDGIPKGSDNRKIFDFAETPMGWLAATRFGLYYKPKASNKWAKLNLPTDDQFVTGIELVDSSVYITTRNRLYCANVQDLKFKKLELKPPLGAKNTIGTFRLLWIIHSGEILGIPGRLLADIGGLAIIFLSITGIIYFISPKIIKRWRNRFRFKGLKRATRFSYGWHLKLGAIAAILLLISGVTGIFLRPPFLIAIANSSFERSGRVSSEQFWHDKLRDIRYDSTRNIFIVATSDGLYHCSSFDNHLVKFTNQPPVSVMGINVLQFLPDGNYLIGSFSGLFNWNPANGEVIDYLTHKPYKPISGLRAPIGEVAVSGYAAINGLEYVFDYNRGLIPLNNNFPVIAMSDEVRESFRFPLWNLAQELHTGRYFSALLGDFYILIVPLSGILLAIVTFSGFAMWFTKKYNRNLN